MNKNADIVLALSEVHQEMFPTTPEKPAFTPEHIAIVELNRREMAEVEKRMKWRMADAKRSNPKDPEA